MTVESVSQLVADFPPLFLELVRLQDVNVLIGEPHEPARLGWFEIIEMHCNAFDVVNLICVLDQDGFARGML